MDAPPLKSLSLTHVSYNPNDPISWISAHLALVPQALVISYISLIWATREIEILLMFTGQMACEALNWILKRYIREERPTQMLGKGYGMPSSHAQYAAFFSLYLSLFLLFRHDPVNHPNASSTHLPTPFWQRLGLAMLSILCAGAVAQSRIYLNYHSPKQVYVGCAAGVGCAVAWFIVTSIARQWGLVDKLLELPPMKWLRMRDLVCSESLEDAGWERYQRALRRRTESAAAAKKKSG
ncbi:hypothetical protein AC578_8510 [Pseudocercospora eumusae]|uniref:Dolichyldiphosphatase n=1 Tax=Pseudocercospora eumusae TaxID=321146 RepID=A0A139HWH1_9PEZI|nr:hypothetical protein AC578_8510 [Pseudocercospora eumusae]